jgi:hypothetical protein
VRYNSQRTITAQTARIDLADESVYLQGSEAQSVRIDGSGAGAAFELSPQGDWLVI